MAEPSGGQHRSLRADKALWLIQGPALNLINIPRESYGPVGICPKWRDSNRNPIKKRGGGSRKRPSEEGHLVLPTSASSLPPRGNYPRDTGTTVFRGGTGRGRFWLRPAASHVASLERGSPFAWPRGFPDGTWDPSPARWGPALPQKAAGTSGAPRTEGAPPCGGTQRDRGWVSRGRLQAAGRLPPPSPCPGPQLVPEDFLLQLRGSTGTLTTALPPPKLVRSWAPHPVLLPSPPHSASLFLNTLHVQALGEPLGGPHQPRAGAAILLVTRMGWYQGSTSRPVWFRLLQAPVHSP